MLACHLLRGAYAASNSTGGSPRTGSQSQSEDDLMTETIKTWRADPLAWGRGPRQFEMFLEPTCPYSGRAFSKLDETFGDCRPGQDNHQGSPAVTAAAHVFPPWSFAASWPRPRCQRVRKPQKPCSLPWPLIARSSNSPSIAAAQTWTPRQSKSLHAWKTIAD